MDLTGKWGEYGYYWKCNACDTNTTMPTVCSPCGAESQRGQVVKIRKERPRFFRACEPCGIEECIGQWVDWRRWTGLQLGRRLTLEIDAKTALQNIRFDIRLGHLDPSKTPFKRLYG